MDISEYAERQNLLSKTKAQYEPGPMRHRLYEVFEQHGKPLKTPSLEWMYYAGMGDVAMHKASAGESKAAKKLMEEGLLVPTFEHDFYGVQKIRQLQHFDDVKFGIDEQGEILIYDLGHSIDLSEFTDSVIRPDSKHDAAIAAIKRRMNFPVSSHAVCVDEAPIQFRSGPIIRPIITDANLIELKHRQREFQP